MSVEPRSAVDAASSEDVVHATGSRADARHGTGSGTDAGHAVRSGDAADPGTAGGAARGDAGPTRRGARSGAIGLAGAAVSGVFGFVLTVVVTRGYGVVGAGGFFTLVGTVTVAGALCCLGADTGLVWSLSRRRDGSGARVLPVAMLPPLVAAASLTTAGLVASGYLAPHLLPAAGHAGVTALRCALGALPAAVAMTLLLSAMRAVRPIGHYAAVQFLLLPVARPILVGGAALLGGGLVAGIVGWLLPVGLAVVVTVVLVAGPLDVLRPGALRADGRDWREFWGFAGPRAVSAAIDAASMWVGVLLTSVLAGQGEAGVFGAVGRYVLAGQLAMQGLRVAVAPALSALLGAGRAREAAAVHRRTTGAVIVLSWPVYLLLALFAPGFLALFGARFTAGAAALTVLAAAMLANVGLGNVQTLLLMSGASGRHLLATVAGLGITLGAGIALIPGHGAFGAACAWGCGIVVENVIAALAARRVVGHPLLTGVARLPAAVLVVVGVTCVPVAVLAGRGVSGLIVALAVLTATLAALLAVPRVRILVRGAAATLRAAPPGNHHQEGR